MKRTALFSLILFLVTIFYSSCREDIYADWKLQNEQWLEIHKNDSGFKPDTVNGTIFYYKKIFQGNQAHPDRNSYIVANYTGTLIDGSTFESATNANLGKITGLVPGLQKGLKKMQDGGHYIFYIPSKIAYDTVSTNAAIPPHSNLIFDLELVYSYR